MRSRSRFFHFLSPPIVLPRSHVHTQASLGSLPPEHLWEATQYGGYNPSSKQSSLDFFLMNYKNQNENQIKINALWSGIFHRKVLSHITHLTRNGTGSSCSHTGPPHFPWTVFLVSPSDPDPWTVSGSRENFRPHSNPGSSTQRQLHLVSYPLASGKGRLDGRWALPQPILMQSLVSAWSCSRLP